MGVITMASWAHKGTFYLKNGTGLYLTNPEDTNKVVLAKLDFSSNQTWCWLGQPDSPPDILKCGTGKVLDIDGSYNGGYERKEDGEYDPGAPVLAWEPHGGINQSFYVYPATWVKGDKFLIGSNQGTAQEYFFSTEEGGSFVGSMDHQEKF